MAGRVAGRADVFGADRGRREPERSETRPRPEAGTQDHPRPAALPGGRPRRVLGRPGYRDAVKILFDAEHQPDSSY